MAGPWERYQTNATPAVAPQGPWEKYKTPTDAGGHYTSDNQFVADAPKPQDVPLPSDPEERMHAAVARDFAAGHEQDRKSLSFATGIGEAVNTAANPLNIPNNALTLLGAPFQTPDPNLGFFQRIGDRFKKASENAIIPHVSVDQLAVGIRGGLEVAGAVANGELPTKKEIGEIFQNEAKSQSDYKKEYEHQGARNLGETVGNVTYLTSLAKDIGTAVEAGTFFRDFANAKAFDALKPKGKVADELIQTGKAEQIGERLLDDNVVTVGASYKNIQQRVDTRLKDLGERIQTYVTQADQAVARDSSIRGVSRAQVADDIEKKIIAPMSEDPSLDTISADIQKWTDSFRMKNGGGDISFQQAQNFKKTLAQTKNAFRTANENLKADAYEDVYRVLNSHIEEGVNAALSKAAPETINDFKPIKQAYGDYLDAREMIDRTVAKVRENRGLSPTDYYAAGKFSDVVQGAAKKIPAVALGAATNRVVRNYGNQITASMANNLAKSFESDPKAFYTFGQTLLDSGQAAGGALDSVTKQSDRPIDFYNSIQKGAQ